MARLEDEEVVAPVYDVFAEHLARRFHEVENELAHSGRSLQRTLHVSRISSFQLYFDIPNLVGDTGLEARIPVGL